MTDKLPPNLLALFAPRPPLRWVPPSDHAPGERKTAPIGGLSEFLPQLQEYKDTDDHKPTESWLQRKDRIELEKRQRQEQLMTEGPQNYKPTEDANIRGDAFKTLIVARLSYDASEQDLEREFGRFGPIERIRIVVDTHQDEKPNKKKKKHRGYAFVVFEREKDMRAALDGCDGIRIKDRRIKVDVERGRTVKGWKPRRFGGGLGGRGYTKSVPPRPMGAPAFGGPPAGPGGGFRGGFRGGFQDRAGGRGGFRGGGGGGGGFQDRGSYGSRGGIGYQGGGGGGSGFQPRGSFGGDRGPPSNYGPSNGSANGRTGGGNFGRGNYGGAGSPDRSSSGGTSMGPPQGGGGYDARGGRSYDDRSGGYRGDRGGSSGSRGYDSRGGSGSNMEPVRPREGSAYRDRDAGGYGGRPPQDDLNRKRSFESGGFDEDPRKMARRY